jgi:hypothetical protein
VLKLFSQLILVSVTAFLSASPSLKAQSAINSRADLLAATKNSLKSPPGMQDYSFGPLKDGRTIRIQLEYLATEEGTQVISDSTPRCIQIDRLDAARASLAIDAIVECGSVDRCDVLPAYLDQLFSTRRDPDALLLLEQFDKTFAPVLAGWQLDQTKAQQWMTRFNQVILFLQVHEIGHILLNHKTLGTAEEAQADGAAAAIANIADLPLFGGAVMLALTVQAHRDWRISGASHPPSSCRAEALSRGLADWYDARGDLRAPKGLSHSRTVNPDARALQPFMPRPKDRCDDYARDFDVGVRATLALVSPQSALRQIAAVPGGQCSYRE